MHDLVRLRYFGRKHFVKDRDSPNFVFSSFEDFVENGRVVWFEHPHKFHSGSYE